jgi:predicted transcriptional regulator
MHGDPGTQATISTTSIDGNNISHSADYTTEAYQINAGSICFAVTRKHIPFLYVALYYNLSYILPFTVLPMAGFSLRLSDDLESRLDEEARRAGVARSEIARAAIADFLAQKERQRYLAAFVAEARAAYADPKIRKGALALAEEAVPLDNEGLRVAERGVPYAGSSLAKRREKKRR